MDLLANLAEPKLAKYVVPGKSVGVPFVVVAYSSALYLPDEGDGGGLSG